MKTKNPLKRKIIILYIIFVALVILFAVQFSSTIISTISQLNEQVAPDVVSEQYNVVGGILGSILSFLLLCCIISMFLYMYKILNSLRKTISNNSVFNKTNVRRIRTIGFLAILMPILNFFTLTTINAQLAFRTFDASSEQVSTFSFSIWQMVDVNLLILGVFILLLAEIFGVGYKLYEEQQFTI